LWVRVAAAIAVVGGGIFGAGLWWTSRPAKTSPTAAVATVSATGVLHVSSEPTGATVSVDGQPRGKTPLIVSDLPIGSHALSVEASGGADYRAVDITSGEATLVDVMVFPGWVTIYAPIEMEVSERGRVLAMDEKNQAMLPSGRHVLTLRNQTLGYRDTRVVDVKAGAKVPLTVELPRSAITITTKPPAEVWIDGQRAGETPLLNVPINVGTRDLVFKIPSLGDRRMTVLVPVSAVKLEVDLTDSDWAPRPGKPAPRGRSPRARVDADPLLVVTGAPLASALADRGNRAYADRFEPARLQTCASWRQDCRPRVWHR
jgi:hypothetical protein